MTERFEWTDKQIAVLKRDYADKGAKYFAEMWGYSRAAVAAKANRLGLKYVGLWQRGGGSRPARSAHRKAQIERLHVPEAHHGARGNSLRIVETVSARISPIRQCAWIEGGERCSEVAVRGTMWCPCCQARVDALRRAG